MLLFLTMFTACGDKSQDTGDVSDPIVCADLQPEECLGTDACAPVTGSELSVDDSRECYQPTGSTVDVDCVDSDLSCAAVITFASPDTSSNCMMFPNSCIPDGWVVCDQLNNYFECGTTHPYCDQLTPEECVSSGAPCQVISGVELEIDMVAECYSSEEYADVGCMDLGMACDDAITYAAPSADPEQCHMFMDSCVPEGWSDCVVDPNTYQECPQECMELAPSECEGDSNCASITGAEVSYDETRDCFEVGGLSTVGCMDGDMICGDAITYAAPSSAPDQCHMFMDTCIPDGWVECQDFNSLNECQ